MEKLKEYDIQIYKLSNKLHKYEYTVSDAFFEQFGGEIVENGKVKIIISLDKRENIMEATITFAGYVDLLCDRSLKDFQHPIQVEKKVLLKYGLEESEFEDNVFIITKSTQVINLSQFIYETIALEVPLKKIHPDEVQDDEDNNQYYYIDEEFESEDDNSPKDEEVDPRWAALKNLKNEN
ncbi:MAG: hypothetical protein ACI9XJ_000117 [Marivirga sp.]|jgi:uncharacterized protein